MGNWLFYPLRLICRVGWNRTIIGGFGDRSPAVERRPYEGNYNSIQKNLTTCCEDELNADMSFSLKASQAGRKF